VRRDTLGVTPRPPQNSVGSDAISHVPAGRSAVAWSIQASVSFRSAVEFRNVLRTRMTAEP